MIYLASPYHHVDPAIMQERYERVSELTANMLRDGLVVYSPIAHNHPIASRYNLPRDWPFWRKIDFGMLRHASGLYVYQLQGWDISKGVTAEIEMAAELDIPTYYVSEAGKLWPKF